MSLKPTLNHLARTVSDCRRIAKARFLAASAIAALSLLFAPVTSAQASFYLAPESGADEIVVRMALADAPAIQPGVGLDAASSPLTNTFCMIQGSNGGECGTPLMYTATSPVQPNVQFNATFQLLNNSAGASFVGPNSCTGVTSCTVTVTTAQVGSFVIRVILTFSGGIMKTCQQPVTVTDSSPPSLICPPNISVPCGSSLDPTATGSPTVSDCSPVTVIFSDAPGAPSCAGNLIIRTWTATDSNGLSATCTQTITPVGTPSITCPGPVSVQCFSQVPAPNIGSVIASDSCGGPVSVMHAGDSASNGQSSCNNVITRTYTVTNGCGIQASCTQTITVNDTTQPSITCPGAVSVQCFSQVPQPNIGSVTTSDNCGGAVTVTHLGDAASNGVSSCNNVITRTYQAADACGNTNTCTQTITVNDTTPPSITCPGPVSVQCFSLVPQPNIGSVTSSDNCGGAVTVTHIGDAASNGSSSCNNVITRTYRSQDSCGNQSFCTQTITVNDTTPPSITCPGAVSVQCFSQVPQPNIGSVTSSDNCGGAVTVTHVGDSASNGVSSCNNVITRTYQSVDPCGNTSTCTQIITVNDTTPPSITCPGPVSVQCFSQVPPPNIGSVTTSDNCGGAATVTHVGDSASNGVSSCNNVITRTYQSVDPCGNTSTCTQTITVNDTTPPSITCPGAVSVQCFSQVPAPNIGSVTSSDNCGGAVTVTHVGDSPSNGQSSCNNVITRTYQSVDPCGNANTCTQIITVNDTTPPSITCPGPVSVQCFSQVPAPSTTAVASSDNCGGAVTVTHVGDSPSNGTSSCNNVITRTYQSVDPCGNANTCTQIITVNDTIPPVITCPVDFTGPCGTPTDPGTTGTATATDNCNLAPIITFSDVMSGGPCPAIAETITRTWTANDGCNQVTCVQIITLVPPPPGFPECTVDLGGACGSPSPILTGFISGNTFSFSITNGPPNGSGLLGAQTGPFGPSTTLPGTVCVIHLANAFPPTIIVGPIMLDATGNWMQNYTFPTIPFPLDVRVQAAFFPQPRFTNGIEIMRPCPPCTYTHGKWAANTGPTSVNYDTNWLTVFPSGMDIGIFNPGNGNAAPNGFRWLATAQGRNALKIFLNAGGGTNSPITQDVTNPTNGFGTGSIARLTAVLQLNVAFNAGGFLGSSNPGFGTMIYNNPGDSLDGLTVAQILALTNQILAGTAVVPAGYTFESYTGLLENLSFAYDNCVPSAWASGHLNFPNP